MVALPVSIALGSLAICTNFIDGVLSKTLSSKRRKKYHELLKIYEQAKNELFLFHQKATIDGKLDDTELKISHEIVERCKSLSLKHKAETSTDTIYLKTNECNSRKHQRVTYTNIGLFTS